MKRLIISAIFVAFMTIANAQSPDLVMWTENYDLYGDANLQTIVLGATADGQVEVDCGYGPEIYDVSMANFSGGDLNGTYIPCSVSSEGKITITSIGDIKLDYVNASGCGLTRIEMAYPEYIEILNLEHNSLAALDLSACTSAKALYLGDNPYNVEPLLIGGNKPYLQILDINIVDHLSPSFALSDYPALLTFDAMNNPTLYECDPSNCPGLMKLSIDATNVSTLDLCNNPELLILNISDTGIEEIDLSPCPKLRELYCDHMSGSYNTSTKMKNLDLNHNPELIYLFAAGNDIESIDLSTNTKLLDLYIRHNKLTHLDLSHNPQLNNVMISYNNMDFNTLPENNPQWKNYEYQQNPIEVPRSYLVGEAIDLSSKLVRPDGPVTFGLLYSIDQRDPSTLVPIDESKYRVENGILKINEVIADSVTCYFFNEAFPDCYLATTMFKVKSEAEYGAKDKVISINAPSLSTGDEVEMRIGLLEATEESPKTFYVDFGDGELQEFKADGSELPDVPNVSCVMGVNGAINIYVNQDEEITAFGIADTYLSDADFSNAASLRDLRLENTGMREIDLQWNRCLETLVLTGNQFIDSLNLDGNNGGYSKNVLKTLVLSNNQMPGVKLSPIEVLEYLDLSHNCLSDINFTDAERIEYLNLSFNDFESLKLNYLSSLKTADFSHNKLAAIAMPEQNVIEHLDIRYNDFTLANIPARNGLTDDAYLYAPQHKIPIIKRGPTCDLSSQMVEIDGNTTQLVWRLLDGTVLDTTEYEVKDGITIFGESAVDKLVYCDVQNSAFPAFTGENALVTTDFTVAPMPECVFASFDTPIGGQTGRLSFASYEPGYALYIDWGNGMLQQYELGTTYTVFEAKTIADGHVKAYAYEQDNQVSVFSISGIKVDNVDFAGLNNVGSFTMDNAGLSGIVLPESEELYELSLAGNHFSEFDFSKYPNLQYVYLQGNEFESVDLSGLEKLQIIDFDNNGLSNIVFDGNNSLWGISLANNNLHELDLSGVPAAYQVMLSGNNLSHLDADGLDDLRVLMIDHNRFDFNTLPMPRSQWVVYVYGDQAPLEIQCIEGVVDLSDQSTVDDMPTVYVWTRIEPYFDIEAGGLVVDALEEGYDYVIEDGVTTFLRPQSHICCLLYNEVFGSAYLLTDWIDATASGLPAIESADSVSEAEYYDLQGRRIVNPGAGIYIKRQSGNTSKVFRAHLTRNVKREATYFGADFVL